MKKIQIFTNPYQITNIFHQQLFIILSIVCIFLGLFNVTVNAQEKQESQLLATPWYETNGNRVRLAITKVSSSQTRNGIVEVELKPGWKTYWRNPGDSGMAPFFNFDQKIAYEIFYPTPQLYETENDWSLGYKNRIVLPFTVSESSENLSGSFVIGICDKICIPFTINFDFSPSSPQNNYLSTSLLTHALATLPRKAQNEFKISAEKDNNTLFIKVPNNEKSVPSLLFLDGGEMQIGPTKKIRDHEEYTLFTAPIYFATDEQSQTIFYTVSFKDHALSGTFVIKSN
ncbi:protein-disulfide reductase DsbD domain-containing protein [Bartonella sp. F02]|uniref:protein-disulfide reductase DsbD domain-containing protein n=1 Tax=Bartonella sp. F02 TaxID=2967262 RepID=UPI0022A997B4|nr:protein-disulfide reductase DsbD domain-containing protein [Bartonella sp. F02]MCZ2328479.1 protein-disulfide reductase DsbD family protein [Bartonella sp. F02]